MLRATVAAATKAEHKQQFK